MPARSLSKDLELQWEPLKMAVSPCLMNQAAAAFRVATLQLCNLDIINDYYIPLVLFYDVAQAHHHAHSSPVHSPLLMQSYPALSQYCGATLKDPVSRLYHALQELLHHHPSAAGVLAHTDSHLELRYPLPASCCSCASLGAANPGQRHACEPPSESFNGGNGYACSSHLDQYGVPFHVAHANFMLSELGDVSDPQPFLDLLFPTIKPLQGKYVGGHDNARAIMAFQVTTFKCGSFALAHTCNHVYADGYTAATFLQNLCALAKGTGLANPSHFPPSRRIGPLTAREPPKPAIHSTIIAAEKRGSKAALKPIHYGTATRFVLPLDAIQALRASISQPDKSKKACSRIQALMALVWIASAKVRLGVHGLGVSHETMLRFPINLRTRGIPGLNAGYMGNAVLQCTVRATLGELCESPLANVVEKIKSSVESLDFHESLQTMIDDIELKLRDGLVPFIDEGCLGMPSLVGLPFYDTDCGWGRPIHIAIPSQQMSNRCAILEHPSARAWDVFAVFSSVEERTCFEKVIAKYIDYKR